MWGCNDTKKFWLPKNDIFLYMTSRLCTPGPGLCPPQYKDHLTIKTTLAAAQRWCLYQGSTVVSNTNKLCVSISDEAQVVLVGL